MKKNFIRHMEVYNDRNNRDSRKINTNDGDMQIEEGNRLDNRDELTHRGTANGNDKLFKEVPKDNDRSSSTSTSSEDTTSGRKEKELENSSSFSMDNQSWRGYVEQNYKATGTRTVLKNQLAPLPEKNQEKSEQLEVKKIKNSFTNIL